MKCSNQQTENFLDTDSHYTFKSEARNTKYEIRNSPAGKNLKNSIFDKRAKSKFFRIPVIPEDPGSSPGGIQQIQGVLDAGSSPA